MRLGFSALDLPIMSSPFKRPESILVVIYTAGGEALMLRRTRPAGFWQSVTGSLGWGESPRHAAERELFEETGLQAQGRLNDCRRTVTFPILPEWRARYAPGVRFNREHWFLYRLPGRRLIRLNPEEHSEYRWLTLTRAAGLASSWTNRNELLSLVQSVASVGHIP
ncbi:MAG: dihydroneopterin triphosphate diphosphatase [Sedimenticola sp.]|nr:MAG: dihydroneopterin triphosphate diphosphatase [Sedimenticola sp.]